MNARHRFRLEWFKRLLCLFATFMLLLSLPVRAADLDAEARSFLESHPVVSIGVIADNEPYSWIDGVEPVGFSIDVLEEISRHTGLRFNYRVGSWPEIYPAFLRGEIDAIDEISYREDRADRVLFSAPYHIRQTAIMHSGNQPLPPIRELADLKPYRVGVVRDIFFKSALVEQGVEVVEFDALPNLVRALAFDWVDAVVGPEVTLMFLARKAGLGHLAIAAKVEMGGFENEDFRIGVLKANPVLQRIIAAGLEAIPPQRLHELVQRWQEFGGQTMSSPAAFRLNEQKSAYVRRLGPLRVGIMRDYAPFSFVDAGKTQGLAVDMLNRVGDLSGLQVITVVDHWPRLIEKFERGEIDIIANISDTEARRVFTRFTQPYFVIPNVLFSRSEVLRFERPEDLEGLRIAVGSGIFYEGELRRRFGDAVVSFSSQDAMFRALGEGSVDVVVAALPNGNHWVRELGLTGVRIAGELRMDGIAGEDLRFGVRPALEPLVSVIDQALAAITPTERRLIENRWLGASRAAVEAEAAPIPVRLNDAERDFLAARGRNVTICPDPARMPLEGLDGNGRLTGMSADLIALFAARSGIRFETLAVASWGESLEAARERRCDMFVLAMQTPEHRAFMSFTRPYFTAPNILLGRLEAPFVDSLGELDGKSVAIVRGYAFAELFRLRYPGIRIVDVDDEADGLKRLQRGEFDAYLSTLVTAGYHLQELRLADIKVIGRVPFDSTLMVGTRSDEPLLTSIAQKLTDSLTAEDLRRIESKWRSMRLEQQVDYSLLWQLAAATLLGLGLLILWNRKLGSLNRKLAEANAKLDQVNQTDALTGLGNRHYLDRSFEQVFRHCQRHGIGFAVGLIDLDHFKQVNDRYGHECGDACLKAMGRCLKTVFRRSGDHLARYGGEEFVAYMSFGADENPIATFEQLRATVEALGLEFGGQTLRLTISVGVAIGVPGPDDQASEYLRRADEAMYVAKRTGRNRVHDGERSPPVAPAVPTASYPA